MFVDEKDLRKEKSKARDLRNSQWWKRKLSKGICFYCGRSFLPEELTMDHVVPLSRGGKAQKEILCVHARIAIIKRKIFFQWNGLSIFHHLVFKMINEQMLNKNGFLSHCRVGFKT